MCFLSIIQGPFALCNISNLPEHKRQTTEFKVHHVKPIVTLPPAWKTLFYRLLGTGTRVRVYFRFHVGSLAVTFTKRHSTSFFLQFAPELSANEVCWTSTGSCGTEVVAL